MKKLALLNLLFFAILPASGQIAVESFRLLETDLTANVQGTMEIDQNGEVAALIKVVTTQQGFTFDNGMLGIVKVVSQPGEFWVYVPRKTQKITISHPDLGILRDYYFQIPVEGARTYELKLTTGQVITTVKKARTTQYLTIRVTPPNATLYVDDELQPLSAEGTFFKLVPLGRHSYRLQASGYKGAAGMVEVNASEKADVSVELQSLEGTLSIECADKEADIVVNEEIKGHGSWKGNLFPGMYIVEARRSNHRTITEEITLGELEKKTVTLSSPIPILGSLRVESEPMGATVYVDGKRMDETPCVLDESVGLLIGSHEVKLSKEGYDDYSATVTLKENEETTLSGIRLFHVNHSNINKDKRDQLYDNLINSGKVSITEIGSKEAFKSLIYDEQSARMFYKKLILSGSLGKKEIGSEDDFYNSISSDFVQTPEKHSIEYAKEKRDSYHEFVDLGLPSGLLWATKNLGASSPEDYGNYYAWSETTTKKDYGWETLRYRTSGFSNENVKFSKYVTDSQYGFVDKKTILDFIDDAAQFNWGGNWRMPTEYEFLELLVNCTWTWTTRNGHNGYKVVSKSNGNSIFLPAAGGIGNSSFLGVGAFGFYWSSSLYTSDPVNACCLCFELGDFEVNNSTRKGGQSIRPVCSP